jgi:Zn-dependent M16 (insulinase) family peptidase
MSDHFKIVKEVPLTEINARLRLLQHDTTGAKVLHIETDDDENAFCISFRTYPDSNNGVAHILEHTVLCGSKKFPVKDPFFLMNRRSLNTFMNAFTGGDFTCYPAATQNKEDFYNLLDVYIDAVFYPNLNRLSFLQEGHRVEFKKSDDPSTPLQFKGIVYNEMKGSYTSPERRLQETMNEKLFPTMTYGIDSGGKPKDIPSLTYEDLLAFHDKFYHPSNALFYFYGNLPLDEHLDFIHKRILSKATPRAPLPPLEREKRFKEPLQTKGPFPIGREEEGEGKTRVSIGWLTCKADDQLTSLALTVLLVAIMDTDASPLKKGLLAHKEIKQVSASIDTDCAEVPVIFTYRGCNEEDGPKIEEETLRLMSEIAKEPIENSLLESALHQIVFHRSEINGDELPWGLNLFMRAGLILQQGGDPEEALRIHTLFDRLKEKWKEDPLYFNKLLQKWLIENPHRVLLTLVPDPQLSEQEEEQEKTLLEAIQSKLTAQAVEIIINDAEALQHLQEDSDSDEDCLPKISLSAIPKEPKDYLLKEEKLPDLNFYHHDTFTNEITYADLIFPVPQISEEEIPYLRLLISFITQLGAGGKGYEETLHRIQAKTGGISAAFSLYTPIDNPQLSYPCVILSGKALDQNVEPLFDLMRNFVHSPDFLDERRLFELWEKHITSLITSLPSLAMRYVSHLATAPFSPSLNLSQQLFGLDYLWSLEKLQGPNLITDLKKGLQKLSSLIFSQKGDLVVTASQKTIDKIHQQKAFGIGEGSNKQDPYFKPPAYREPYSSQGRSFASPVAYISQVIPSVPYVHPDAPLLSLASFILDNQTLHTKIREQGGAYGAGSRQQSGNGLFSFYSYRDPHIGETLNVFKSSIEHLLKEGVSPKDREEAVLEIMQGMDAPISPGTRGITAYAWLREGRSLEARKKFRERLLKSTPGEIAKGVETHLLPSYEKGVTVVAASEELLQKENERRRREGLTLLPVAPLEKKA